MVVEVVLVVVEVVVVVVVVVMWWWWVVRGYSRGTVGVQSGTGEKHKTTQHWYTFFIFIVTSCTQYNKRTWYCYEMDKTSIFMFEILEPGGSALGKYSI